MMVYRLVVIAFLMSLGMTCLSAFIRLSDSGIDCENWPDCYTSNIVTDSEPGINIHADDSHQGLRFLHRMSASAFGVLMLVMVIGSIWYRNTVESGIALPVLAFVLTMILAVIGMYTPDITKPIITLINLSGGMLLTGILWCWLMKLQKPSSLNWGKVSGRAGWMKTSFVLLTLLAIVSGAWVSGNYAIPACDGFMNCDIGATASLTDALSLHRTLDIANGLLLFDGNEGLIGYTHHVLALLTLMPILLLGIDKYNHQESLLPTFVPIILILLLMLQGLSGLISKSLLIANIHNFLAMLLLLSAFGLYRLVNRRAEDHNHD